MLSNQSYLEIINISNPASPQHVSTKNLLSSIGTSIYVVGNNVFTGCNGYFEIIDVSNALVPTSKGNVLVGGTGDLVRSIYVSGTLAYVGGSNYMNIYDVSNVNSISLKGQIFAADPGAELNGISSIFNLGSYTYVTSFDRDALEIVNTTTSTNPTHASWIFNGTGGAKLDGAWSVSVSGNYAYVASSLSDALEIINVTTKTSPSHLTSIVNGTGGAKLDGPESVFISGSYAYLASFNSDALEIVAIFPPVPVTTTSASATGLTSFTANWNKLNDATGYFIDVATDAGFSSILSAYNNKSISAASTSTSITGLTNGTIYYYRVRATNASGTSSQSNVTSVITLPAAPASTAATSVTQTGFTANWSSVTGAANYLIDVATDAGFSSILSSYNNKSVAGISTAISSLTPGITYFYRVRASNASGASVSSGTISQITIPPDPAVSASSGFTQTSFQANWASSTGATNYFLDVSTSSAFATLITGYSNKSVGNVTNLSVNTNLNPNTLYYYRVRASNAAGVSGSTGNSTGLTIPASPSSIAASSVMQTSFTANWNAVSTSNYFIDVATDENFANILLAYNNLSVATNSLAVTTLSSGTTYWYRVRAANSSGSSPSINKISQITIPANPAGLAATGVTATIFVANWEAVTGASSYELDVSQDNFATFVSGYNAKSIADTNDPITGLTANTVYRFRVRSVNAAGLSSSTTSPPIPTGDTSSTPTEISAGIASETTSISSKLEGVVNPKGLSTKVIFDWGTSTALGNKTAEQTITGNAGITVSTILNGLTENTLYYFRISATSAAGTVSGSTSSFTTSKVIATTGNPEEISTNGAKLNGTVNPNGSSVKAYFEWGTALSLGNKTPEQAISGNSEQSLSSTITGLQENTLYYFRVTATTANGIAPGTTANFTTGSGASKLKFSGTPSIIQDGNGYKASITIQDGSGPKVLKFYYRGITGDKFESTVITSSTTKIDVDVTRDKLDKAGLEYYFTASDITTSNIPIQSSTGYLYNSVAQAIPNLSIGGQPENYRIISIPAALTDAATRTVFNPAIIQFGGYDINKWRLMHYQPGDPRGRNVDFEGITKIETGSGYWFNSIDKVDIGITGTTVQANQSTPFKLALQKGWNQIGDPYTFDVSWSDILKQNGNPAEIGARFYMYDAENISFKESAVIPAWGGGFVKATAPITLNIPVTVKQTGGRGVSPYEIQNSQLDEPAWFLPIHVVQGKAYNNMGGIGMHTEASSGNDRYDEQSLPRFQNYLELNSYHNDFFIPRFTRDVVPTAEDHTWDFTVESNFDSPITTLTWNAGSLGNNAAQLKLFDAEAGQLIDMKKVSTYSFASQGSHAIKIFYSATEKNFHPETSGIGKPYPNPASHQVTIPFFSGSHSYGLQVTVFDATGRKIKELVTKNYDPGFYQLVWDSTDDQGNRVAPGMYLYRFTSSDSAPVSGRLVIH